MDNHPPVSAKEGIRLLKKVLKKAYKNLEGDDRCDDLEELQKLDQQLN